MDQINNNDTSGISPVLLNTDLPFFYSLNVSFASNTSAFEKIGNIVFIATNLRYEASLLNNIIRREQTRRSFTIQTLGAFNPSLTSQTGTSHIGNST